MEKVFFIPRAGWGVTTLPYIANPLEAATWNSSWSAAKASAGVGSQRAVWLEGCYQSMAAGFKAKKGTVASHSKNKKKMDGYCSSDEFVFPILLWKIINRCVEWREKKSTGSLEGL